MSTKPNLDRRPKRAKRRLPHSFTVGERLRSEMGNAEYARLLDRMHARTRRPRRRRAAA